MSSFIDTWDEDACSNTYAGQLLTADLELRTNSAENWSPALTIELLFHTGPRHHISKQRRLSNTRCPLKLLMQTHWITSTRWNETIGIVSLFLFCGVSIVYCLTTCTPTRSWHVVILQHLGTNKQWNPIQRLRKENDIPETMSCIVGQVGKKGLIDIKNPSVLSVTSRNVDALCVLQRVAGDDFGVGQEMVTGHVFLNELDAPWRNRIPFSGVVGLHGETPAVAVQLIARADFSVAGEFGPAGEDLDDGLWKSVRN